MLRCHMYQLYPERKSNHIQNDEFRCKNHFDHSKLKTHTVFAYIYINEFTYTKKIKSQSMYSLLKTVEILIYIFISTINDGHLRSKCSDSRFYFRIANISVFAKHSLTFVFLFAVALVLFIVHSIFMIYFFSTENIVWTNERTVCFGRLYFIFSFRFFYKFYFCIWTFLNLPKTICNFISFSLSVISQFFH